MCFPAVLVLARAGAQRDDRRTCGEGHPVIRCHPRFRDASQTLKIHAYRIGEAPSMRNPIAGIQRASEIEHEPGYCALFPDDAKFIVGSEYAHARTLDGLSSGVRSARLRRAAQRLSPRICIGIDINTPGEPSCLRRILAGPVGRRNSSPLCSPFFIVDTQ